MLVEINLLPQKPKRSIKAIIISAMIIFSSLALFVIGYFVHESKVQQLTNVNNEINMVIKLRELAEQALNQAAPTDALEDLQKKIDWIYSQQISTVELLNHFVSLLPERGFFMNYQYNDQGTVTITIQFDSPRQAASYLHQLNESTFVHKATLQQLSISEITDQREAQEQLDRFQYLPRYIGNFTIEVNREAMKQKPENGGD